MGNRGANTELILPPCLSRTPSCCYLTPTKMFTSPSEITPDDVNSTNSADLSRVLWAADISRDIFGLYDEHHQHQQQTITTGGKVKPKKKKSNKSSNNSNNNNSDKIIKDLKDNLDGGFIHDNLFKNVFDFKKLPQGAQKRYIMLFPLNWGARRDFAVMLARDSANNSLVIMRHYCYSYKQTNKNNNNKKNKAVFVNTPKSDEEYMENAFIPFTVSWKKRINNLLTLRHEHLLPITDVIINEEELELVLVHPYTDGMQPLASILQRYPHLIYRELTPSWLLCILREVTTAVLFLHRHGIVHGSLSPWTILLDANGHAFVTGFAVSDTRPHPNGVIPVGSAVHPFYMAPEVRNNLSHRHVATKAADTFTIGALAFAMTWEKHEVEYITIRRAVTGAMHNNIRQRITLNELDATLAVLAFTHNDQECVVNSYIECDDDVTQTSTKFSTLTASQEEYKQTSLSPVVVGILQREPSAVLFRTTGLDKWDRRKKNGEKITPLRRLNSALLSSQNEDFDCHHSCGYLPVAKWRSAALAVLFCAIISCKFIGQRKETSGRFIAVAAGPPQQNQLLTTTTTQCGELPVMSTTLAPSRPRRPEPLQRLRPRPQYAN